MLTRAIRNLGAHPRPTVTSFEAADGDPDTTCYALGSDDVFAASVIGGLDLLPALVAPGVSARYGVVVAVPYWRLVLLHVLRGGGGVAAIGRMAAMTESMLASGSIPPRERLSSDVFYVAPDERVQVVGAGFTGGSAVETRGLIREHYLVPAGLAPPEGG